MTTFEPKINFPLNDVERIVIGNNTAPYSFTRFLKNIQHEMIHVVLNHVLLMNF